MLVGAISNWIRDHVETTWHSLGTCAMKPRDQEGVLDPRCAIYLYNIYCFLVVLRRVARNRLNVYGTANLKVGVRHYMCPI